MNAKEMCEKLKEKETEFWINKVFLGDGKYSTEPIPYDYSNNMILYHQYNPNPSVEIIKILEQKGFKIIKFEKEFDNCYRGLYKTIEKEIGVWPFKKKKSQKVFDKYEIIKKTFTYYEISACCGEEK